MIIEQASQKKSCKLRAVLQVFFCTHFNRIEVQTQWQCTK
nr:MAG TPA: hypothetical protein [Caudoviricetes sp.]